MNRSPQSTTSAGRVAKPVPSIRRNYMDQRRQALDMERAGLVEPPRRSWLVPSYVLTTPRCGEVLSHPVDQVVRPLILHRPAPPSAANQRGHHGAR